MHISTPTLLTFLSIAITATATALPSTTTTTNTTTTECYLFQGCGAGQPVSIDSMWTLRSRICGDGTDSRWKKGGELSLGDSGRMSINGPKCGSNQALCWSAFENVINQCFETAMLGLVTTENRGCAYFAARCY